ncbi:MAG: class II D-tagatose-bisphosphate aldolase, non-catalytic subunit [Desulfobacterales bacterium]|nr:class II D-tagatose-bisphosphate aldolase, non-catalytic subunit [Desulfobacterales bacterium]
MLKYLKNIANLQRNGIPAGVYSVCSSNPFVLKTAMLKAKNDNTDLLVEATCNQVNQFGGYMGLKPLEFIHYIKNIANEVDFPFHKLTLGGDHLGPYLWRKESGTEAMNKAIVLIKEYVKAGFVKIHLDASMMCVGDPGPPLPIDISAKRAAQMCMAAEEVLIEGIEPLYVIGAEVPTPGGSLEQENEASVTDHRDVHEFLEVSKLAFKTYGVENAWERVIAVVVQPGIDFGNREISIYSHDRALNLSLFHNKLPNIMTYEIHSTDYQPPWAIKQMVRDHFPILKVGPCLTYAFREAVFSLIDIEEKMLGNRKNVSLSNMRKHLEEAMIKNSLYLKSHNLDKEEYLKWFSLYDRIRYYWTDEEVEKALSRLIENLSKYDINPIEIITSKIREAIDPYTKVFIDH